MHIKIHRGTQEIGGSCVEVWTDDTRIVIDIGMPLVEPDGTEFNLRKHKKLSPSELIAKGILPDIPGFYKKTANDKCPLTNDVPQGLLVSHAHMDHFGLGNYINPDVPWHMGKATHKLIDINSSFTPLKTEISNVIYFQSEHSFNIGDIKVTPFLMDHSAFDSYAFLLEVNGKTLLYSGDFRRHGRKPQRLDVMLRKLPEDIDCLLMEGTALGRESKTFPSEFDIEDDMQKAFANNDRLSLVWASGQNIDRLVTIYKAAVRANKIMLVDFYTGAALDSLANLGSKLPTAGKGYKLEIYSWKYNALERFDTAQAEKLRRFQIGRNDISQNQGKYVMVMRPSCKPYFNKMDNLKNGLLVYSLWGGYLKRPDSKKFTDWLESKGFTIQQIHTSGHADIPTMQRLTAGVNPKTIIPIHTFHSEQYRKYFGDGVKTVKDREKFKL